jgi:hypothetical protein
MYWDADIGSLFNPRQKLALITFAEKVRQAHAHLLAQGAEPEFAKAVATYLALVISSRLTDFEITVLCRVAPSNGSSIPFYVYVVKPCRCFGITSEMVPLSPILTGLKVMPYGKNQLTNIAHLTCIPPVEDLPTRKSHHRPRHRHRSPLVQTTSLTPC